jgi:hypothetical protein
MIDAMVARQPGSVAVKRAVGYPRETTRLGPMVDPGRAGWVGP